MWSLFDMLLFLLYTVANVTGLVMMKSGMPAAQAHWQAGTLLAGPTLIVGIGSLLYIASFLLWLVILARNELSVAYPVAVGLTLVFSTASAKILLGEALSPLRGVGVLVIFFGIFLVARS